MLDAAAILSSPTPVAVEDESVQATPESEAKAIVEPTKPEEKKDEVISPRLAMLAKEEKRLQEERKRLQEERKNPEFSEFQEFKKLKANAKTDPLSVLEKLGLSYDEITDYVISGKHTKDSSVRALEEKLANMEKEAKEREEKAKKDLETAQLQQFQEQIKNECLKNPDDFELVNVWGAHNLVYNVIQAHYDKTEEILPVQEAAKKVEAYLEEESKKYQGSKKLRKLFGAPDPEANKQQQTDDKADSFASKMSATLSNSASSGTTSTQEDDDIDPRVLVSKAAKLLTR